MIKALLWKEWREQRTVAAAGVGMSLLLPAVVFAVALSSGTAVLLTDITDMIPFLLAAGLWPLVAGLAGASTSAQETDSGALGFLLSRPVARGWVWLAKVLVAAAAVALVVSASFALAWLIDLAVGGHGFQFPFSSDPVGSGTLTSASVQLTALALPLLAFGCALLLGLFWRNQVIVALAGCATALALVGAGITWQRLLSAQPWISYGGETFLLGFYALSTIAVLAGAFFVFCTGAMLPGADRKKILAVAVVGGVVAIAGGTQAMGAAVIRSDSSSGHLRFGAAMPDGAAIVVRAQPDYFTGESLWLAAPGRPLLRLTGRMAYNPVVDPRGEWIVYGSRLGPFGLRRERCELRAVRPSGADDHVIHDGVYCAREWRFSRDGSRVAVSTYSGLAVASIKGAAPAATFALGGAALGYAEPLAWSADDRRVLWLTRKTLSWIDVTSGQVNELANGGDHLLRLELLSARRAILSMRPPSGVRIVRGSYSPLDYLLLDLETGVAERSTAPCALWIEALALIDDGARLLYLACSNAFEGSELWLRDFASGAERRVAAFDGQIYRVHPSPSGERLRVIVRDRDDQQGRTTYGNFIADLDGNVRLLETAKIPVPSAIGSLPVSPSRRWQIERWLDDAHLLLARYAGAQRWWYARFNVPSGDLEMLAGNR